MSGLDRVADGVYRLGSDWVGWYLCDVDGEVTIVDTGFPGYFDQLPAALSELGRSLDAVAAVALTHYHGDHTGSAERIRVEAGATVFAPAVDADGVQGGKVPMPGGLLANLWRPRVTRYIAHAIASGGAKPAMAVEEVRRYDDGEVLDVPGRLRAIHTPGHTGGHCSLLAEELGVLFTGDALTTASFFPGGTGIRVHPFNEDTERARQSVAKLEPLAADVLVFGHGPSFAGSPAEAVARALSGP